MVMQFCFGQWYEQESGTTKNLHDVVFLNEYTGIAVGDSGLILRTTNDGQTWVAQSSGTSNHLNDVCFYNSNTAWAVGDSGTIIKTTNGGVSWVQQSSSTFASLNSVCFINENQGWICGADFSTQPPQCELIKTTDGGINWIPQPTDSFPNWDLKCIDFTDESVGWIINDWHGQWGGYDYIYKTTDGGSTWNLKLQIPSGPPLPIFLNKLKFVNQNYGVVVGGGNRTKGHIYRTTDGGETWDEKVFPELWEFRNVFLIDEAYWTVVGDDGRIYNTTDSGENWVQQYTGTNNSIKGVHFVNELVGWAVGDNGTILHTNNGGVSFIEEEQTGKMPKEFLLSQNFPNPFNPSTKIKYRVPQTTQVQIKVFDVLGNEIEKLVNEEKPAGTYEFTWNAANLPSGIYFYRFMTSEYTATKKMIVTK